MQKNVYVDRFFFLCFFVNYPFKITNICLYKSKDFRPHFILSVFNFVLPFDTMHLLSTCFYIIF